MVEADNGSTTSDTRFLWCGLAICEARDSTGATVTERFFPQGVQDVGVAYFYTRDHLGSVRELTDSTGTVRARYDYDPWGRRTKVSGDKNADIGYTGHYQHLASGLTLALFRAYDPTTGRWISTDPMGWAAGTNSFAYSSNNPVALFDPLGLCPNNQDPDQQKPYDANKFGPEDPTNPGQPLYRNPLVKKAMNEAWTKTANGTARSGLAEAGFTIDYKNGVISIANKRDSVYQQLVKAERAYVPT